MQFGQPHKLDDKQSALVRKWRREGMVIRAIVDRVQSEFGITLSHTSVANYINKPKT